MKINKSKWLAIVSIIAILLSLLPAYVPQAQAEAPTVPEWALDWDNASLDTDRFEWLANNGQVGADSLSVAARESRYDVEIHTSKDGKKWIKSSLIKAGEYEKIYVSKIYYASKLGKFILLGQRWNDDDYSGKILIATSADGKSWTEVDASADAQKIKPQAPVSSNGSSITVTIDGDAWLKDITEVPNTNGTLVAVGTYNNGNSGFVLYSKDSGVTWTYTKFIDIAATTDVIDITQFDSEVVASYQKDVGYGLYIGAKEEYYKVDVSDSGELVFKGSNDLLIPPHMSTDETDLEDYRVMQTGVIYKDGQFIVSGRYYGIPEDGDELSDRPLLMVLDPANWDWTYKMGLDSEIFPDGVVENPDDAVVVRKMISIDGGYAALVEYYSSEDDDETWSVYLSEDLDTWNSLSALSFDRSIYDMVGHYTPATNLVLAGRSIWDEDNYGHSGLYNFDKGTVTKSYESASYNDAIFVKDVGYVAVGDNGLITYGKDGGTDDDWQHVVSGVDVAVNFTRVVYDGTKIIAVGEDTANSNAQKAVSSTNGYEWAAYTGTIPAATTLTGITNVADYAESGGKYVAVKTDGKLHTSADNTNWTAVADETVKDITFKTVTAGLGYFVAAGEGGKVFVSADNGTTWSAATTPITQTITALAYGDNGFVALADKEQYAYTQQKFTLTYDANGDGVTGSYDTYSYVSGESVQLESGGSLERPGYGFIGWNSKADGSGKLYAYPSEITIKENTTVYAQWAKLVAGGGQSTEEGIDATQAQLGFIYGLAVDAKGNLYFSENNTHKIKKINTEGKVSTFAGTGEMALDGDGPAATATFNSPSGLAVDKDGHVYVADTENQRIRQILVSADGTANAVTTIAGAGNDQVTGTALYYPKAVAFDKDGNLIIADTWNNGIRMLKDGALTKLAGAEAFDQSGFSGNGGPATSALLNRPEGIAFDKDGNLYIADTGNYSIRKVDVTTKNISTLAGNGYQGSSSPDGTAAVQAQLGSAVSGITVDKYGNIYFIQDYSIRKIDTKGVLSTIVNHNTSIRSMTLASGADNETIYFATSNSKIYATVLPVEKAAAAPTIITQPEGKTVTVGGTAELSVVATADTGTLSYQWYSNTTNTTADSAKIEGATSSTYKAPTNKTGTTYYYVVVTNTLDESTATTISNIAKVTVNAASGGGGGSTTPTNNTNVNVIVNGKTESIGQATTTTVGNQTQLTLTVDQAKLQEKLDKEGNNATVIIPVTNTKADVIVGQLNGQMVKNMEDKQATVVVQTPTASYTLPASQINIDAISNQMGQNVDLKDIQIQITIAKPTEATAKVVENAAQQGNFSIVVPAVEFTVTYKNGNQSGEVTRFNAYVERTIAIPDGVDPNKITTGIVVKPDGTTYHVPTKVEKIDGKYYAVINSLTNSTYSVVWHPIEFADVTNHWAKEAVNNLGSRMVISGVDAETFAPNRAITRAEFAAIMVRGLGLQPGVGTNTYTDVANNAWYADFVSTANEYNLIAGYEDGTFRPNEQITREQAMAIIARAMTIAELTNELTDAQVALTLGAFKDANDIAGYAKEAVAASVQAQIVTGRDGQVIAPKAHITRAEVAQLVETLLQKADLINE